MGTVRRRQRSNVAGSGLRRFLRFQDFALQQFGAGAGSMNHTIGVETSFDAVFEGFHQCGVEAALSRTFQDVDFLPKDGVLEFDLMGS